MGADVASQSPSRVYGYLQVSLKLHPDLHPALKLPRTTDRLALCGKQARAGRQRPRLLVFVKAGVWGGICRRARIEAKGALCAEELRARGLGSRSTRLASSLPEGLV